MYEFDQIDDTPDSCNASGNSPEIRYKFFRYLDDFEDFWCNLLEIDMDMVVKMFDKLKPKLVKAKNDGLESLL